MRNIRLLYIIQALHYAWFWLGIWVLYYKGFGGFAAVGLLETVMIVSTTLFEIPTGAIGDLLGKRRTLLIGFSIWAIAQCAMGISQTLFDMVLTLIAMNFGGALISGTFEAMVYDSLKDEHREKEYGTVISNLTSISLLSLALCGAIGGPLYAVGKSIPFLLTGGAGVIAVIVAFFLTEPHIDSEKLSIKGYIKQNFSGFAQLFATKAVGITTVLTLLLSSILLIFHEGVNDMLVVVFEFTEVQMGFISSGLALFAAGVSYVTGKLKRSTISAIYPFMLIALTVSMLVTPFVGAIVGLLSISVRSLFYAVVTNEVSVTLNEYIDSRHRATALSTFSMLKSLPYIASIYLIGVAADRYPLTWIVFGIGIVMIGVGYVNYRFRLIK